MLVLFTLLPGWGYVVGVFCLFLVLGRCFFFKVDIKVCAWYVILSETLVQE